MKKYNVDNISDVPPVTDAVVVGDGSTETVFKEEILYLPIEDDVDLQLEIEMARHTQEKREAGYRLYREGMPVQKIAYRLCVPLAAVSFWAKDGSWADRLRKQNDVDEQVARESVRKVRIQAAEADTRESTELAATIRKTVKNKLESGGDKLTPMNIKNLADAAKATGDLGDHSMGHTEQDNNKGLGRPLVVMVNGPSGLPPIKRIDIDQ